MMSIGKLAAGPGAGRYYIDQVAQGREDYYAGEGEAAGVWMGTGAAGLGLTGEVGEEGLARLLEGRDPSSGLLLRPVRSSSAGGGVRPDVAGAEEREHPVRRRRARGRAADRSARTSRRSAQAIGLPRARGVLDSSRSSGRDPAAGARLRRGGVPAPVLAGRRSAAAHARRGRERDAGRRTVAGRRSTAASCTGMRRRPATSTRPPCGRSCRASSGCAGRRSSTGRPMWRASRAG